MWLKLQATFNAGATKGLEACKRVTVKAYSGMRTMLDRLPRPGWSWIGGLSIINFVFTLVVFTVQFAPRQNLTYVVEKLQSNSLPYPPAEIPTTLPGNPPVLYDTAFDLQITVFNRGNQPASGNISLYIKDFDWTKKGSDRDCVRYWNDGAHDLYLYEHEISPNENWRGTETQGDFGRKIAPAFAIAPSSTATDEHRYSLFDQQGWGNIRPSRKGILCVDVLVSTTAGAIYHTPEALALLSLAPGEKIILDRNFSRFNQTDFSVPQASLTRDNDLGELKAVISIRHLYRSRFSRLLGFIEP